MPHKTRKLLLDISLSCQKISDFIDGKSFEDFQEDRMLQLAIERESEIIGEALHRLTRIEEATLAKKIPEYRKIIDFRNIIAHGYDIIDEAAMWDFAINRVPEWLDFSGKVLGALGVSNTEELTIPPFVPNRVASQRYFTFDSNHNYLEKESSFQLHIDQESENNLNRKMHHLIPESTASGIQERPVQLSPRPGTLLLKWLR